MQRCMQAIHEPLRTLPTAITWSKYKDKPEENWAFNRVKAMTLTILMPRFSDHWTASCRSLLPDSYWWTIKPTLKVNSITTTHECKENKKVTDQKLNNTLISFSLTIKSQIKLKKAANLCFKSALISFSGSSVHFHPCKLLRWLIYTQQQSVSKPVAILQYISLMFPWLGKEI